MDRLPALAAALGLEPGWEPLAAPALDPGLGPEVEAAVVGRRARFVAVGLAPADASAAQRVARELARAGQAGLVLGLDERRERLAVAASFADCPVVSLDRRAPGAADLRRLSPAGTTGLTGAPLACQWAEALAGLDLGHRFFRQFRATLDGFAGALARTIPAEDRHTLALLVLTRVLFLYFVQERGWLDGRPRFLADAVDRTLPGGSIERDLLRPLFFGTLNRPGSARPARARRFGRIPYLNGGLFEPHPLERRWRPSFGNDLWREAFDGLFERHHFTVRQGPGPDAIGPDMLGRVFEGVMDPAARRAEGAFYTPAAMVTELFDAALADWLALRLGVGGHEARRLLAEPTVAGGAALATITVLDPSVGSGAFLLGALQRLVGIRAKLGEPPAAATRAVLASNLFGVDRNPAAVRLAELRLWLAVLDAEPSDDPVAIAPLPNLDSFVRQGDSLAEPSLPAPSRDGAERLARARREAAQATGGSKAGALMRLRRLELDAARASIGRALEAVDRGLRERVAAERDPDLFAERAPRTAKAKAAIARLRTERRRLRTMERRLRDAGELPWFHFAAQFGDVLARGGFDVVIGNPPWVRGEALSSRRRAELKERYRWCRSAATGRGFGHFPDLSLAFLERSFELLRQDGVLGMLVPAKLTTAGYAATARAELARRSTLLVAERLRDHDDAFGATVYPLALVAARRQPEAGHHLRRGLDHGAARGVPQQALGAEPWSLEPGARVLARLRATHPTLGERFTVRLGVKTGLDRAFLDPDPAVGAALLRPVVRGRDIGPFRVSCEHTILWTHDRHGRPRDQLPEAAARHLAPHRRALERRADHRGGPYWQLFRTTAAMPGHRVVWADLARQLEAAVLSGPAHASIVPLNTSYLIAAGSRESALRLAVWLNAGWVRRLARLRATVAASGFARFNADVVEALPLPDAVMADVSLLAIGERAWTGSAFDQEAADDRCAELLALAEDDRAALLENG
ncbi:MAG: hypothetical protein AB7R55_05040 [Gemmatimonadales bacterium]